MTTSQKLAHRVARELEEAYGGRAHYVWSDREGVLDARWDPPTSGQEKTAASGQRREPIKRRFSGGE